MPRPEKGESLADYMHRFMGSGEAKSDFKSRKQRVAVGLNMFREAKRKRRK
jgi:outer membrane phospholipase A